MREIFLKERQQSFTFSIHCLWNRYFWKKVLWKRNPWKKYFWKRDNKALHFHSPLLVHLRFHKTTHICGWTVSGFDIFYIILSSNTMVDHFKTYTWFTQFTSSIWFTIWFTKFSSFTNFAQFNKFTWFSEYTDLFVTRKRFVLKYFEINPAQKKILREIQRGRDRVCWWSKSGRC